MLCLKYTNKENTMLKLLASAAVVTAAAVASMAQLATASAAPAVAKSAVVDVIDGNMAPANYWYQQPGLTDCATSAANFVIGAATGSRVKSATIDAYAQSIGAYAPGVGTDFTKIPAVMAHYGVQATVGIHSLATLEEDLRTGHRVVALVDAGPMWALLGYDGHANQWHAVSVDQINVTENTVTVTDSGPVQGQQEVIPMDVFKKSWGAGGYWLVVTS